VALKKTGLPKIPHWVAGAAFLFLRLAVKLFQDLTMMERAYRESGLDYLLVRPIWHWGGELVPVGEWYIFKRKV
jgi:hypothetical protein